MNPVVGDFQVMRPAVHKDTAATLRTVADRYAIDARRVAIKVAGEAVAITSEVTIAAVVPKERGVCRESIGCERIRSESHTFRQNRDGRSFICAHQGWLLQLFRKVAIQCSIPTDGRFQR